MLVIGYRGAPSLAPENTMLSFIRAVEIGVDYIEFDVRVSKDEVLAVIHDNRVDRTTDSAWELGRRLVVQQQFRRRQDTDIR